MVGYVQCQIFPANPLEVLLARPQVLKLMFKESHCFGGA